MAMKYLAAHLMAVVAGDSHPSKAKIEAILQSIGAEIDEEVLAAFLHKVEGKNHRRRPPPLPRLLLRRRRYVNSKVFYATCFVG